MGVRVLNPGGRPPEPGVLDQDFFHDFRDLCVLRGEDFLLIYFFGWFLKEKKLSRSLSWLDFF